MGDGGWYEWKTGKHKQPALARLFLQMSCLRAFEHKDGDGNNDRVVARQYFAYSNPVNFPIGGDDANGFAPSFIEKPRIIPNDAGTLITMKCRCKAKPAATVTWYRGTTVVKESTKIAIKSSSTEEDIYELILEIKVSILPIFFELDAVLW